MYVWFTNLICNAFDWTKAKTMLYKIISSAKGNRFLFGQIFLCKLKTVFHGFVWRSQRPSENLQTAQRKVVDLGEVPTNKFANKIRICFSWSGIGTSYFLFLTEDDSSRYLNEADVISNDLMTHIKKIKTNYLCPDVLTTFKEWKFVVYLQRK